MIRQLEQRNKRIIFVRHGESIGNAVGLDDNSLVHTPNHRFTLTAAGKEQAREAGRLLEASEIFWERAFFSSYLRTWETLSEINHGCSGWCHTTMDPRLDEWWRGIWHTMSKEDIARLYPLEEKIQQREGWYHYRAPGGQSGPDVELQIHSFLSDFFYGRYSFLKTILIVGHGKWAILFWRIMNGATIDEAAERLRVSPFGNCSITVFDGDGVNSVSA